MAIIPTNFNSLELTSSLPANFIDWFPIWSINSKNLKWTATIPKKYLPLDTIAIGEDIAYNIMIAPPARTTLLVGTLGIIGAMQAIREVAASIGGNSGDITLSRKKSWGQFGQDTYNYYSSPRFGYQIGSFKQQAYFKVRSIGTNFFNTGWSEFNTIPNIEYVTNNRLKKLYLSHGKILGIRKELGNIFYVSLCAFSQNQDVNFTPSGTLNVWSLDTTTKTYNKFGFDLSKTQITDNGELIFDVTTLPDVEKIFTGDFFTIDKPWILEDYSLLFEYGLQKNNGFYETNEQKFKAFYEFGTMNVKGVWTQVSKDLVYSDESKETVVLWTLYTDLDASVITLPTTPEDEKYYGENMLILGTLKEGIEILKKSFEDGNIENIRVVIFGAGGELQNFYPPSLVGEFVKVEDNYFEIMAHPRTETIEIQINSANAISNFTDVGLGGEIIDVFQQKFWFTNELYYNYPYSIGLWQTEKFIKSLATNDYENKIVVGSTGEGGDQVGTRTTTNTLTWTDSNSSSQTETKTIVISSIEISKQDKETSSTKTKTTNISLNAYDVLATFTGEEETTITTCTLLTERFYKPYSSFKFETDDILTYGFYKKFTTWYFWNISKQKVYKILDATFEKDKSWTAEKPLLEIKLTLEGDLTSEINIGSTEGYIFTDLPHQTYSGNHGEMTLSLNMAPSLSADPDEKWYAYMYGNYYSGTYVLPEPASQFLLTSFAYGDTVISGGRDIPNVLASVIDAQTLFVSGVTQQIGSASKDYLFFVDPENLLLVYRNGSCAWRFDPQRKLVVTMEPNVENSIQGLKDIKQFITQIIYNCEKNSSYWFVRPKGKRTQASLYESYHISKNSYADTSLTRLYNLEGVPTSGIYFPFEFSSSVKKDDSGVKTNAVAVDTYFPSNLIGSGECLEKIYGEGVSTKNTLTSLIDGGTPSRGSLSSSVQSISYVDPSKVLQDVKYLWTYSTGDSSIYLFYNMNPPEFYIEDVGGSADNINPPRPSVFVLVSDSGGKNFYSPNTTEESNTKASSPLMLLYDFDFGGGIINKQETFCCLFGFTYERGFGPADKDEDDKFITPSVYSQHCFLAMYHFNLNDVFIKDDTYQFSNKDGTTKWVGRFPKLTATQSPKQSYEYGTNKNLFGHKLQEVDVGLSDYNDYDPENSSESSQYFISILNQSDAKFEPKQISVTINESETITLFIGVKNLIYKDKENKENTISGIVSLKSSNGGTTWTISVDDNNTPIIYNDNDSQINPYQLLKQKDGLSSLLFLVDNASKQLVVKNIKVQTPETTTIIAQNVLPQKIYAIMQENGAIYVYYIINGNVVASVSNNGGITWKYLNNW